MLMYPKADVPVVAMSLHASLDAEYHIRIGHVLSSLRSQGRILHACILLLSSHHILRSSFECSVRECMVA